MTQQVKTEGGPPNPSVYREFPTFICVTSGCMVNMQYAARPIREIAGNYLEEISTWLAALDREGAPRRVLFALRAAYESACSWTDELDAS